ncbi:MAG: nucleotide exchange factor GrpE [Candidatus Zambryskibacteria bacterium RIFCSPHIGHO2_12_FULL_38_34]|uniref:Protein GrpE n=1 Tax=Candidatus Zambryskibacteria bacterium RIFCSPLOWO2_12_FULL_39_16 TaxID=1802775 RepID=A0A1G2USQ9_9BACT|nr:MAG: nucleotide exchange factor GrpE [Candidatus Zambryskibacteria bacterium RIFCSPHIGHO2_02_FULL_38_22]OHA98361.1 MAG: nucleotide exchange factor GrpE [Candidatus Zambryskibacteria bacterium RIFCSPHIGHO2_12_FULL_38_34]OHB08375.1 MAG: nucleotide exchange factor GrpE [Candidatus Zambryskibacteria bacterium RIFCSPLOWO2_02_FULL_38_13]OHB12358.1 MAG: nucleotide exchange factor GrpE [Candidatus Zambryskibacteria bacterium RIFCSPLOWO2_12_FULL_39_16]
MKDEEEIIFDNEDEESNPAALIKKLREKVKKLEEKSQEYLTGWQKERADGVNLRKRLEEEKREFAKFAKEDIATEIIPVLDSFESAFKNKEAWEKVDKNWRQGVEYIHSQLVNVLSNHGISIISPLGEQFDPQRDEAIENVPIENPKDNHKILEVVSVGYKLQDKIIRPPKVKVAELK